MYPFKAKGTIADELFEALRGRLAPGVPASPGELTQSFVELWFGLGAALLLGGILTTWAAYAPGIPVYPGKRAGAFNVLNWVLAQIGPWWIGAAFAALNLYVVYAVMQRLSNPPRANVVVIPGR
jgi:hypothetical protein